MKNIFLPILSFILALLPYCAPFSIAGQPGNLRISKINSIVSRNGLSEINTSRQIVMEKIANVRDSEAGEIGIALVSGLTTGLIIKYSKVILGMMESLRIKKLPVLLPIVGGVMVSFLYRIQPDLMLGAATIGSPDAFNLQRQMLRYLAVIITVGSGNALALAGPAAEIGMTVARALSGGTSRSGGLSRSLILSGAASGFTANFDSPMAGILYALEVSRKTLALPRGRRQQAQLKELLLLILSTYASAVVVRGRLGFPAYTLGPLARFSYPAVLLGDYPRLLGVAAAGGLIGHLLSGWVKTALTATFNKIPKSLRPIVGGGFSCAATLGGHPQSLATIYNTYFTIATGQLGKHALLRFMAIKALCTQVSSASGLIGGMIAPLLIVGSALGCLFGSLSNSAASFTAIGSVSVLAAFYQAPFTFSILIMEMTQQLHLGLPLLIVGVVSNAVAEHLRSRVKA